MAAEGAELPSIISNPPSIRRDDNGILDERCLTPRSRELRDAVADELRLEVLRQYGKDSQGVVQHDELDYMHRPGSPYLKLTLPELLEEATRQQQEKKRKSAVGAGSLDKQITLFHNILISLARDSVCWNRLVFAEAFCIERIRSFAEQLGTDVPSSFVECLKDKFPPVRRFAIEGFRLLAQTKERTADHIVWCGHLGNIALNDQDWRLRAEAARVLATLGEQAIPKLVEIVRLSTFWPLRCEAALSLGAMEVWRESRHIPHGGAEARSVLQAALGSDRMPGVRESAAKALGMMGNHALDAVQPLILGTRDEDLRVRIAAVGALGKVISHAAEAREVRMHYEPLMAKADLEQIGLADTKLPFADSLRLACRALTRTLRDQEALFKLAVAEAELEKFGDEGFRSPTTSLMVSRVVERDLQDLKRQHNHVKELFRAAEVALAQIGPFAGPNMVVRLIEEDEAKSGFPNRMSLLRGLTCSANGFDSDDLVCAILSEWVAAPALGARHYLTNMTAVANLLPVTGLHLLAFAQDFTETMRYAVLHGDAQDVYVAFATMNQADAVSDLLLRDNIEPRPVEVVAREGGTYSMSVHSGMWESLECIWDDLCRSLQHALEKTGGLRRFIFTGGGVGGALAKLAALRFHAEEAPLGDVQLPMPDDDESESPAQTVEGGFIVREERRTAGMLIKTYGSPNVISSAEEGSRPELMHCSKMSTSWELKGDLLPKVLSKEGHLIHGVGQPSARRPLTPEAIGCCKRRQKAAGVSIPEIGSRLLGKMSAYTGFITPLPLYQSPRDKRSLKAHGLNVSLKAYTNSMCWHQLTKLMPP